MSGTGTFWQTIGTGLPVVLGNIAKQKQDEEDAKRQALLDEITMQSARQKLDAGNIDLQNARDEQERKKAGLAAVGEFVNRMNNAELIKNKLTPVDTGNNEVDTSGKLGGLNSKLADIRSLTADPNAGQGNIAPFSPEYAQSVTNDAQDKLGAFRRIAGAYQSVPDVKEMANDLNAEQARNDQIEAQKEAKIASFTNQKQLQDERLIAEAQRQQEHNDLIKEIQNQKNTNAKLPANDALRLGDTKAAINQLDTMMDSASKTGLWNNPADKLRALNPFDKDVQSFNQLVASTKQLIGKGLEGGVLRKEDESKYDKIIPKLGDTKEVLQTKADQLRDMLINKYNTDRESLGTTYNVSGFDDIGKKQYGGQSLTKEINGVTYKKVAGGWQRVQ